MNDSNKAVLALMLDHCRAIDTRIHEFDIDENSFVTNSAYFDMLLMPLFQIGELAGSLSADFTDSRPGIPWHAIRGLRNIIAHDYGVVEPLWVWNTIQVDIPLLKSFLEEEGEP